MKLRKQIHRIINGKYKKTPYSKVFDIFIMTLIILSVAQVILESYTPIKNAYAIPFHYFEIITVSIFTIEYFLRIWTADLFYKEPNKLKAIGKYIFSPMGLIDLVAILPVLLPIFFALDLRFVRILRVVRLLRVLKLNRYTKSLRLIGDIIKEKRYELGASVFVCMILILVASTIMFYLEHDDQPENFPNIVSTFWWAVATLTTVGYGDVYPVTGWGKFISGIIAVLGIGLVALPAAILSSSFGERINKKKEKKLEKKIAKINFCPHCGKELHQHV